MFVRCALIVAVLAAVLTTACSYGSAAGSAPAFVTDYGLGPDKWATAWLLTRKAAPGATLVVVPAGQALPAGTPFDVPGSALRRQGERTAFEMSIARFGIDEPAVGELARVVNDIEVNFWSAEKTEAAPIVEHAFRVLQKRHGRDDVPPECYLAFFDQVHAALEAQRLEGRAVAADTLLVDCVQLALAAQAEKRLIPEVPIDTLLAEVRRGKRIVFVDAREPEEFAEARIPGARNILLRDIRPDVIAQLAGADYVVSYCVKDFRGFEMARALQDAGVRNSVILKPYGIRGWVAAGLPTTGTKAMLEAEATARLAQCIDGSADCQGSALL